MMFVMKKGEIKEGFYLTTPGTDLIEIMIDENVLCFIEINNSYTTD